MKDKKMIAALREILEWAKAKTHEGSEPPWAWFQYMKLIETIDAILKGTESVNPKGSLRRLGSQQDSGLRLVETKCQRDIVLPHHADAPPQLPM